MAELKTQQNEADVDAFIASVDDDSKRDDCRKLLALMRKITRKKPTMWGETIVGFGSYHYQYASGREGDWFVSGFSPRKRDLTVYIMPGFSNYTEQLAALGKHKTGKSCLYIKRLADIDLKVLEQIIRLSVSEMKTRYQCQ